MGACASSPSGAKYGGPSSAASSKNGTQTGAPVSRRYLQTPLELSTPDKTATAMQPEFDKVNGKPVGPPSRRDLLESSRGPAAESMADLRPAEDAAAASMDWDAHKPAASDDSFEIARIAACKELARLQRSHRSSTAAATAWPAPGGQGGDGEGALYSDGGDGYEEDECSVCSDEGYGSSGIFGRAETVGGEEHGTEAGAGVLPIGRGAGQGRSSVEAGEASTPPRRGGEEEGRAPVPDSTMVPRAASESDQDLADPPLPGSLQSVPGELDPALFSAPGQPRPSTVGRHSEASYLQPQPQQQQQAPQQASALGGASARLLSQPARSSDMGYYYDAARLVTPTRGATPVRHNLLDTPLARKAEQQGTGSPAPKPATLEYVPQTAAKGLRGPSRGNLLLPQPSQRQRQQADAGLEAAADVEEPVSGAGPRRLDYIPTMGASRRWTAATPLGASTAGPIQQQSTAAAAGSGHGMDTVSTSRKSLNPGRLGGGAASGTLSAAQSPRASRTAGGVDLLYEDVADGTATARSSPLAPRRGLAAADASQRALGSGGGGLGGGGRGPLLPAVSRTRLEGLSTAPVVGGGMASPRGSPTVGDAPPPRVSQGALNVAWTDLPQGVIVGRPAAVAAVAGGGGSGAISARSSGTGLTGSDGWKGAAAGDRTSRLLASLHRLGVAPPAGDAGAPTA